jgi:hypothetical protein
MTQRLTNADVTNAFKSGTMMNPYASARERKRERMNNNFWFGFWLFIFPFMGVGLMCWVEERVKGRK